MYLALDQAPSKVGFAHAGPDSGKPAWGVFPPARAAMECSFRDWLQCMLTVHTITRVIYEEPYLGKKSDPQALLRLCALPAVIRLVCGDLDIPCEPAPISAWRKHFIGYSKAPKEIGNSYRRTRWLKDASMRACVERNWFVTKDDEADALGILDWALCRDFPNRGNETAELFRAVKEAIT